MDRVTDDIGLLPVHSGRGRSHLANLQSEGAAMVAGLRANSSISHSVIPSVVDSVNSMTGTTIDLLLPETVKL